jgi:hypothetical protein
VTISTNTIETSDKGGDRVYTITYQAADDSGNVTAKTATVKVPCSSRNGR